MRARRLCIGGSLIGSIKETQEMLDLCGEKNITCDVEVRCSGSAGVKLNMTWVPAHIWPACTSACVFKIGTHAARRYLDLALHWRIYAV